MNRIYRLPLSLLFALLTFCSFFFTTTAKAQVTTTTVLTVSPACLTEGCVTTLTATVTSGGSPVHPGLVVFCDKGPTNCENEAPIGRAQLTANGTATIRLGLSAGSHTLRAIFHGTKTYGGSASTSQSLTDATNATDKATTSFVPNYNSVNGGFQFISYLNSLGNTPPTGNISFLDTSQNNLNLGSVPIVAAAPTETFTNLNPPNPSNVNLASTATAVLPGDFNNDGKQDFVQLGAHGIVSVSLGDGTGNFTAGPAFAAASTGATGPLLLGDFNSDGKLDIALSDSASNFVRVLLGNGDGTFAAATPTAVTQASQLLRLGDFNGDGIPDLVSVSTRASAGSYIQVLLGKGDGTFNAEQAIAFAGDNIASATVGDFNQDGFQDIAFGYYAEPYGEFTAASTLGILKGNGDGTFAASPVVSIPGTTDALAAGDFDGDGVPDIMAGGDGNDGYQVTFYRGNGDFTFNAQSVQTTFYPGGFTPGDYFGNGSLEVFGGGSIQGLYFFGGSTNNGPVESGIGIDVPLSYGSAVLADYNGDGLPDLLKVYDAYPPTLYPAIVNTNSTTTSHTILLSEGVHSIVASYPGDANHNANVSVPVLVYSSGIAYPEGFGATPNVTLNGSASLGSGVISLTNGGEFQAGSFFTTNRLDLSGQVNSVFDFQFPAGNADGFAYVFQANGPDALGSSGGGLGYGNPPGQTGASITNSVALAFDLHNNQGEGDNSIRLEYNGVTSPEGAIDITPSGLDFHSGHKFQVQVIVNQVPESLMTYIQVILRDDVTRKGFTQNFTLPTSVLLPGNKGYVGFTSSTGTSTSAPTIYDWVIQQTPETYLNQLSLTPYYPSGFTGATGLLFNGGSVIAGSALELTNGTPFKATSTYASRLVGAYNATFNTDFDFNVGDGTGDGFTFVLQDHSSTVVGSSGGGLGYGVDYLSPAPPAYAIIPNSLAIKFDLHNNQGEGPNSTGLYLNGASPTTPSVDLSSSGINLHSGHTFHARITYTGGNQIILTITDLNVYKVFQTTFTVTDASVLQAGAVYAGFTAGTGATPGTIKILNWTLTQ